jgi:hypothetical protein
VIDHVLGAHPLQEPDLLPRGWLLAIFGIVTLLVIVLGAWAVALSRVGPGENEPVPERVPAALDRSALDWWTFEVGQPSVRARAAERERLRAWGWVDRSCGVVAC